MEFLNVGKSKLKIIMSDDELSRYGLSNCETGMDNPDVRRAFWRVLELAGSEVGFDPTDDKVLVQFYPIKKGGGEIFVTKLGLLSDSSARVVSSSDRVSILSHHRSLYRFESLDDLVRASVAVSRLSHTSPTCDVYLDSGGKYYMLVDEYGKGGESSEYPILLEFGKRLTAELSSYICEHALCLAVGNGVELMSCSA